jgi:hypothetical protein
MLYIEHKRKEGPVNEQHRAKARASPRLFVKT